jgi:hypothetical protein
MMRTLTAGTVANGGGERSSQRAEPGNDGPCASSRQSRLQLTYLLTANARIVP